MPITLVEGWFKRIRYGQSHPDDLVEDIARETAKGKPVPVGIAFQNPGQEHGFHAVLVNRVADGRVHYLNPWGQQESMTVVAFKERVTGANLED